MLKRPPAALTRHLAADRYLHRTGEQRSHQAMPAGKILSLRKRLLQWNKVAASAPPLPPRLQLELRGRFKSEIDKLGRLIGRELSDWLLPEEQQPEPAAGRRRRVLDAPAFWRGTA
jgi:hypothetical protein